MEATERLVGFSVFKTVGGSQGPRQVRFLSASANGPKALVRGSALRCQVINRADIIDHGPPKLSPSQPIR